MALLGACSQNDEKAAESIREQLKGKTIVPVGEASKLLLPDLKAKAKEKPDDFQTQFDLARAASQAHEFDVALEAAEKATRLDPTSIPAKEIYAQCLHQVGKMAEAGGQWEEIIASGKPHSTLVESNLGNLYKLQGRLQDAEQLYRKAMESGQDETHGLVFLNLADLQIKLEKFDEAVQTIQKGLGADPKQQYAHQLLGRIAFLKGDFEGAVRELNTELERRPSAWEAYFLIGLAQGRMTPPQLDKAEEAFAKLSEMRPSDAAYFKALMADLYIDGGQVEKGRTLATEALGELASFREDQRNAAYHALAKAYLKLGDQTQANEFRDKFRQSVGQTDANDPEQRRRNREMDSLFGSR
jgi:tetratricopeptide (TPR) repeat protein